MSVVGVCTTGRGNKPDRFGVETEDAATPGHELGETRMKLTRVMAAALLAGGLGLGSISSIAPIASAQAGAPLPQKPGHGNDFCPPICGNGHDGPRNAGHDKGRDDDGHGQFDNRGHGDDKGSWWNSNRHDWWDDRNGPPPWGWGPPPPIQWHGGPPPHSVNYWGYNLNPVWNDGPRQWGVWLFGQWIPIFGVGFN